jgi:DNA mismatch endonuclease (patch repair protein)
LNRSSLCKEGISSRLWDPPRLEFCVLTADALSALENRPNMKRILKNALKNGGFGPVPPSRSRNMRAIKASGNRTTEARLRLALVRSRIRGWVLRPSHVEGKPDFYFSVQKLAIFVDGCFWHGCPRCGHIPRTNTEFWKSKISINKRRDRSVSAGLATAGIKVLRVWECELRRNLDAVMQALVDSLVNRANTGRGH